MRIKCPSYMEKCLPCSGIQDDAPSFLLVLLKCYHYSYALHDLVRWVGEWFRGSYFILVANEQNWDLNPGLGFPLRCPSMLFTDAPETYSTSLI